MLQWNPVVVDGVWRFRIEDLRALVAGHETLRLIVTNFPHNPTGACLSSSEWDELVQICRDKDSFLFSDEMYLGLGHGMPSTDPTQDDGGPGGVKASPALRREISATQRYEKAVSLSGMSKVYNMPGIRIGWLTTRDKELFNVLTDQHDYATICASAPSEILALIGLRAGPTLRQRNIDTILVCAQ